MRIAQVRALVVVGLLIVIALVMSWYAIANDSQTASGRDRCEPGDIPVDITLPEERDIKVKVLNATDNAGLADTAAEALKEYGFDIEETGDSDRGDEMEAAVEIYYGPKMVAGGHLLRAYLTESQAIFDKENDADFVEITLGPGFQQVSTQSEARSALGIIGRPTAPEGTCPNA